MTSVDVRQTLTGLLTLGRSTCLFPVIMFTDAVTPTLPNTEAAWKKLCHIIVTEKCHSIAHNVRAGLQ